MPDATLVDSWYYYFSTLAQTIAGGSALLVALAVIRLQALADSLNVIERSAAQVFFDIGKYDDYRIHASLLLLDARWKEYFRVIQSLADTNPQCFAAPGSYGQSRDFLNSLITQGRMLRVRRQELHRALTLAFGGTVLFAGIAIVVLPAARWLSPQMLYWCWAVSSVLLVMVFTLYVRLVLKSLRSR